MRTCVGCRERDLRSALLRLVLEPSDGERGAVPRIVADVRASLPGRGAWIHPTSACLELADRRRAVPRALRVGGPVDLAQVRDHLEQAGRQDPPVGAATAPALATEHARPHPDEVDKEAGQKPMGTR